MVGGVNRNSSDVRNPCHPRVYRGGGGANSTADLKDGSGNSADIVIPNNSASATAGALSSASGYAFEAWLVGNDNADKQAAWNEAVSKAGVVLVTLQSDWTADTTTNSFGTGTGFTANGGIKVPAGKKIVINLNGHNIDRKITTAIADGSVITVETGAELEITGSGNITGGKTTGNGGGVYSSGTLYLIGGNIYKNEAEKGGGVFSDSGSSVYISNGTISENKSSISGAGICFAGNVFEMSGGNITANESDLNESDTDGGGGGVAMTNGTATISGGAISGNSARRGGGIFTRTAVTIDGGSISDNEVKNSGGGIFSDGATVTLNDGTISGNKAGYTAAMYDNVNSAGGAIMMAGGTFDMNSGVISGNTTSASSSSSAVTISGGTMTMNGGYIINNPNSYAGLGSNLTAGGTYHLYAGFIVNNNKGFQTSGSDTINLDINKVASTSMVISGNTNGNLCLAGTQTIKVVAPLHMCTVETYIGITCDSPTNGQQITTNYSASSYPGHGTDKNRVTTAANSFFSDNPSYVVKVSGGEVKLSTASGTAAYTWKYRVNGGSYTTASSNYIKLYYGDVVDSVIATKGSTTFTWNVGQSNSATNVMKAYYTDLNGALDNETVSALNKVGLYLILIASSKYSEGESMVKLTIEIAPKPVEIKIKDTLTSKYGDPILHGDVSNDHKIDATAGTTYDIISGSLNGSDSLDSDLEFTKTYGYNVGEYVINGSYSGTNYDVTIHQGKYTVTADSVEVKLYDQQVTYGSKYYTIKKDRNTTKDNNGTPLDTTDDFFNGGWDYTDTTPTTFKAADIAATSQKYPLVVSCRSGGVDLTSSSNTAYINAGDYVITYTALPNYNVTFTSDNTNGVNDNQTVLTVKKAKLEVDKVSGAYKTEYTKAEAGTSGKQIEIPDANIKLKGDTTATKTIKYADPIFASTDEKTVAPTQNPELDGTDYKWKDGTDSAGTDLTGSIVSWNALNATALTKKAAGTYKVYFLISVANHEDLVQEWTMVIKADTVTVTLIIEKDSVPSGTWTALAASTNAVYGDTIRANIDYTALSGITAGSITNYTMYYVGTGTTDYGKWDAATDQNTADLTDKISVVDSTKHKDYGTTNAPTGAGTYKATLVGKAGEYDFGTTKPTLNFTIEKKKITTAPTRSGTTVLTYNGSAQGFKISNFDDTTMEYVPATDYITPSTDVKETLDATKFTSADNWTLEGTNAYDYLAGFKLKDNDNYEWDSSLSANLKSYTDTSVTPNKTYNIYELKLTINKAKLKVDFTSPQKNADSTKNDSWDWEPDDYKSGGIISYEINSSSIIVKGGTPENVTVSMIYVEIPASGAVAVGDWSNVSGSELTANGFFEIKDVAKGKYYVSVKLKDDSTGDDVNKNYTVARNETTGEYTNCTQVFEVTDGTASVSSIKWQYTYTLGIDKETKDLDGATIKYQRNGKVGNYLPVEYTVSVIAKSLPDYLEVKTDWMGDATKGVGLSGWSGGYNFAKQTNANTQKADKSYEKYSSYVALHIKDKDEEGNNIDIVFSNSSTDYTYIDDKTCELKVEWTIEKGTLDLDGMLWGYTVGTDTTVKEFREVPKKDAGGNKVPLMVDDGKGGTVQAEDEDGNLLYVTVHETDAQGNSKIVPVIRNTGYPADVLTVNTYSGDGIDNTVNKSKIGSELITRVSFTLVGTNYEEPDEYEFEWAVTNATLSISGWNTTTGTIEIGGEKYKTPVVTSTDPDIAQKVEYVYSYKDSDGNDVSATLDELWKKIYKDIEDGKAGKIENVTVQVKAKAGYQLDSSKPDSTYKRVITLGESGTTITVTKDKKSGEYGKASIKITLKDIGGDDLTGETDIYYVEVFDKDGNSLGELGNGADLTKLSAGTYKIKIVIRDGMTEDYSVKAGEDEITFVITPIELELPTLKNPVFDGSDINVTVGDYLDETTLGYLSSKLISFTGDTSARNTGKTYLLKVNIVDTVNYVWKEESGTVPARFTLLAEETVITAERKSGELAHLNWEVQPLVITEKMMTWKGLNSKNGAQLVLNLKEGINYKIEYKYYTDLEGGSEVTETKAGDRVYVAAILGGEDAELGNIVFAKAEAETNGLMLAERQSHTVPKSSIAAVAGNALNFVKTNWLWFVIALAVLLFLIILICIIRHRKKTKEERLAKKEAEKEKKEEEKRKKEEEKQRKEEERIRKEEEREAAKQKQQAELEAQKAKQQAELELAKAKQEAELAKIKAQAGMAGAGVAAMAMAQQPQQQQMPQQMPQQQMPQQPMQQPQAQPQYNQAPAQAQPQMQQQPYPQMQQGYDGGAIARLEAEFKAMRNEQRTDAKLENELLKLRLDMKDGQQPQAQQQVQQPAYPQMPFMPFNPYMPMNGMYGMPQTNVPDANMLAEKFGLMMATMMKNMGVQAPPSEPVAAIKSAEESKPVSVAYPPDAVVTTTTTVDTTKSGAPARSREDDLRALDIDGFYDTFEENK